MVPRSTPLIVEFGLGGACASAAREGLAIANAGTAVSANLPKPRLV
jgi:hypothetical protein